MTRKKFSSPAFNKPVELRIMVTIPNERTSIATYQWQDGSSSRNYVATRSGTYWVEVTNSCGSESDTVSLAFEAQPTVDLGADQTVCRDEPLTLVALFPGSTYRWQDGSSNPNYLVTQSGSYWVEVENTCGSSRDTVNIIVEEAPIVNLGEDRTVCNDNQTLLEVIHPGSTFTWQDGSSNPYFMVTESGTYWVEAENTCGSSSDTVRVIFPALNELSIPNVFTPNGDKVNGLMKGYWDLLSRYFTGMEKRSLSPRIIKTIGMETIYPQEHTSILLRVFVTRNTKVGSPLCIERTSHFAL